MPLWGKTDADESAPKWVKDVKTVLATAAGWVLRHYKNDAKTEYYDELLVPIKGLNVAVGSADIIAIEFLTTEFSAEEGGNIDVVITFNEAVDVTGTPQVTIANSQDGSGTDATVVADYLSGTGTNRLVFREVYAAEDGGVAEDDELSIGANCLALNSGTIKDAGTATNSTITSVAGLGTAAGVLTISA